MIRRLGLTLLVGLAACSSSDGGEPSGPPTCEMSFTAPSGFAPLEETFREEYPDHVGVRFGFRDDRRRELHVLVGIPGEIGGGLTVVGEVTVTGGRTATLQSGRHGVWVIVWEEGDRCDPTAVIANGIEERAAFLSALAEAGGRTPGLGGVSLRAADARRAAGTIARWASSAGTPSSSPSLRSRSLPWPSSGSPRSRCGGPPTPTTRAGSSAPT